MLTKLVLDYLVSSGSRIREDQNGDPITLDKFGGLRVAWSRFDGSCKDAFNFMINAGFWKP